jgi:dimeric dUTPase (all-alpha-NTP-PPase superfamily)
MVTEKYLLRSETEWQARQEAMQVLDEVVALITFTMMKPLAALALLIVAGVVASDISCLQYWQTFTSSVKCLYANNHIQPHRRRC